ncbi:MAG: citramalate synthase, partial [Desulfomonilaceae bacterium]
MNTVELYDTTLRDGAQTWGVHFSVEDKLRITKKLDELGIDFIEGGYPGSNPKDRRFFEATKGLNLKHAKIAAFGSTCRADTSPEKDSQIKNLIEARTDTVTIVGKSWDLHVTDVLAVSLQKNLAMISDT